MGDNREQIDYWNGQAGDTWTRLQDRLDNMLAPVSDAALNVLAAQRDESVVDVGCGCGATSLAIAQRGASVLGLDISEPMLARARLRAEDEALSDACEFRLGDAGALKLEPTADALFSRFGVMFFDDPVAAFSNLRGGLKPGARLVFACWQEARANPWMAIAGAAIAPLLPPSTEPVDPRAPGPFAFADPSYVEDLLGAAGFTDINLESFKPTLHVADDLDDAIAFQSEVGPLARALAELEADRLDQARDAARAALASHVTSTGLDLDAAVWLVTAQG